MNLYEELTINMEKNGIKDRLFDALNDTDNLPTHDIIVDDRKNMVKVYLVDETRFLVHIKNCGK